MAFRDTLTRDTLTGNSTPHAVTPIGSIPVPGFDASYVWHSTAAGAALSKQVLGGAVTVTAPSGGVLAVPDAPSATVVVQAWWAYATAFSVVRVDESDDSRIPVRDAESWTVTGVATRRNLAIHPTNAAQDLTGWTAGTNTTLASVSLASRPDPRVITGVRATATAAGSVAVSFPLDATSTATSTYGLWVNATTAPSAMAVTVTWYDVNGSSLSTSSYPIAATAVSQTSAGWSWCQATITGAPTGAVFGIVGLSASGVAAGGVLMLTGRLWEMGSTLGSYFDGSFFGGNWVGTTYKSASTLSPVQTIVDAEAPLDTTVHYEVTNPTAPGYAVTSDDVVLDSDAFPPRDTLVTHPGLAKTIRVWIQAQPEVTNAIEQSSFQVIGRRRQIVISAPQRSGDTGNLTFVTETADERAVLMAMLDDGSPLLLRTPAAYGHPPLWWLSFADAKTSSLAGYAPNPVRLISADFTEVDRPSAATRPLVI